MLRYLKAAFFVRPLIPGLGRVPINLLGVIGMAILGLGHPGFWALGLGMEMAFLAGLASMSRFQRLVDGEELQSLGKASLDKRQSLIALLEPPSRARLAQLQKKTERALDISRQQGLESYIIDSSTDALDRLCWVYLRLLLARQFLLSSQSQSTEADIRDQVRLLQRDLKSEKLPPLVRESKAATCDILLKRLENFEKKEQSLMAIDSDLMRIEAQAELAVENATMSNQPQAISSNITLASHLLDPFVFGSSEQTVADLDRTYSEPQPMKENT
jgi:hypothetical protein